MDLATEQGHQPCVHPTQPEEQVSVTGREPGELSRYSDWLQAGRPRGRSSSPGGGKNFHFSMLSTPALGPTQPPIQWVPGALSPEVKRQGREADHSPQTTAEVKKMWLYTSILYTSSWRGAYFIKHRDNFTLTLPVTRRSSCTPRHWVPFSSPPTTRRATVEVFVTASTLDGHQHQHKTGYIKQAQHEPSARVKTGIKNIKKTPDT
jgi:hypothetical protein